MNTVSVQQQITTGTDALLCLTTMHHRRFLEDVVHIIGMPVGTHIRLRYRKPYVDPALWHRVLTSPKRVKEIAIIVLAGNGINGGINAAPIRAGTIVNARCEGELLILDLALEDFIFENSPKDDLYKKIESHGRSLPKSLSKDQASKGVYLQKINTNGLGLTADSSVKGWEKTAAAFFKIDEAQSTDLGSIESRLPFLYFLNNLAKKSSELLKKTGYLNLEMGKQITIEVHTVSRPNTKSIVNPLGEVMLEISHPAASFTSSRRVRVDSSRDVKTIGISTSPLFRTTDGHISVRTILFKNDTDKKNDPNPPTPTPAQSALTTMLSADKRAETVVARYDFPLKVGKYRPLIACGLIAGATALSVYKFSSQGEFKLIDIIVPVIVFVLTITGLSLGLIKK